MDKISVGVKSQDGDTIFFKVAPEKKIQELLKCYCAEKNFKYKEYSFLHNGTRIQPTKTFLEVGIEDGDQIDVMGHQDGGGNPRAFTT
ncbi:small ubiquitin-related modifier 2-like [Salvia miltiorrhiza]|uniref:small ubiquitin-related modifier 2-like n=1 Tax=Salvia miltiorrhiza TaxID=226208 RepID=UPI0025ABD857|nr:small ubiquitin-related modifier 2-like [Salvia miltiorrhiza]